MDANARFARCLDVVLKQEGGFSDLPGDNGGATKFGISTPALTAWRGHPVSRADVWNLTKDEAAQIYRADYWNKVLGDLLPPGADLMTFDMAVNMGPGMAARILQQALGVTVDGLVGPRTVDAADRQNSPSLIESLAATRMGQYQRMSGWARFGRGWTERVQAVTEQAKAWANEPPQPPAGAVAIAA